MPAYRHFLRPCLTAPRTRKKRETITGRGTRRGADSREHGDRPRLDRGLPRGAAALLELADRPAVRAFRRRELPRLRRARPGGVLRPPPHRRGAPDHVAADAAGLPLGLRGARSLRADLRARALEQALRDVRERSDGGG